MNFDPGTVLAQIPPPVDCRCLVVALSGGLDSTVLLHSLALLKRSDAIEQLIRAIHVNHGIHVNASQWQEHCETICRDLAIPLEVARLELGSGPKDNLELRARDARYEIFSASLQPDEYLLMAHHRDDQMETLLMRLLRGSGPGGLAAIPRMRELGQSRLLRPLLGTDRKALLEFANSKGLTWVSDDSNACLDFDRNYIRHELLPLIENRWPGYRESWGKSIQLNDEAADLLDELAAEDLNRAIGADPRIIELAPILLLSEPRQRNLLKYWLNLIGFPHADWQILRRLTGEIITAGVDSPAYLVSDAGCIKRFRNRLYALASNQPLLTDSMQITLEKVVQQELPGNGRLVCAEYPGDIPRLHSVPLIRHGLNGITLQYRLGGEVIRLRDRPTRMLKKLMQEAGLPPWLRRRQPLLYYQDQLICVPGIGVSDEFAAADDETGYAVTWEPPDLLYKKL